MHEKEGTFQQAELLRHGELVIKVPGTTFRMSYSSGEAFVSEDVGYIALSIGDLVAESTGDVPEIDYLGGDAESRKKYPWIYMGQPGKELAAKLDNPSEREEIAGKLKSGRLYLAYSNFGGYEALTMPGTAAGDMKAAIDNRRFDKLIVGFYDLLFISGLEEEQRLHNVLALHSNVLAGLEPNLKPVDRKTLEEEVLQLVSKANRTYNLYSLL